MTAAEYTCASCGHSRTPLQQSGGAVSPPRPGDFWLCPSCGEIHRFQMVGAFIPLPLGRAPIRLGLRIARVDDLELLPTDDLREMLALRDSILAATGRAPS